MTIKLRDLQENLQAYLLTGAETISKTLSAPAQDPINTRLDIYRDSYYLNLTGILQKDFSLIEKLVGEEKFTEMAAAYIESYPSIYFNINQFGERFSAFLSTAPAYTQQLYLSELAAFSFAFNNSAVAADAPVLTVNDLAAIPQDKWQNLKLKLHPAVKLLEQHYNSFELWQALQKDQAVPAIIQLEEPRHYLIWRKGLAPCYDELSAAAACMLNSLLAEENFAEVCERLTDYLAPEAVAQYAVNQLITWLQQEIFCKLIL